MHSMSLHLVGNGAQSFSARDGRCWCSSHSRCDCFHAACSGWWCTCANRLPRACACGCRWSATHKEDTPNDPQLGSAEIATAELATSLAARPRRGRRCRWLCSGTTQEATPWAASQARITQSALRLQAVLALALDLGGIEFLSGFTFGWQPAFGVFDEVFTGDIAAASGGEIGGEHLHPTKGAHGLTAGRALRLSPQTMAQCLCDT